MPLSRLQVPTAPTGVSASTGRRLLAVLDDDPTGSQVVRDLDLVLDLGGAELAAALQAPGSTAFLLTNTRSLDEPDAAAVTEAAARSAFELERRGQGPVDVLLRGDSTLRGHVLAEADAVDRARRSILGRGYHGFLLCPAYIEAGRVTSGDIHYARVDGELRPVAETDYADDATFGYGSSNLRTFLAERTDGAVRAHDVRSIILKLIREGGVEAVALSLAQLDGRAWAVANAETYEDLHVVAQALRRVSENGRRVLARGGPSLAQAMTGAPRHGALRQDELKLDHLRAPYGLVVVGSHVGLSGRQLEVLRQEHSMPEFGIDVATIAAGGRQADAHVQQVASDLARALIKGDAVLSTSRKVVRGADREDSLRIARAVSAALVAVVASVRAQNPAWVIAKGGITSHDIARHGLGIRRARVIGQLWDGLVSVVRPQSGPPEVLGMPYVIFAGNVGDDHSLADAVTMMRGDR